MAWVAPENGSEDHFIELNGYYGMPAICPKCGDLTTDTELSMYGTCGKCLDENYQAYCDKQLRKDFWRRIFNFLTFGLLFKAEKVEDFEALEAHDPAGDGN